MNKWLVWLAALCIPVLAGSYAWTHRHHVPLVPAQIPVANPAPETRAAYAEEEQAQQMITVTGPLADYMTQRKPEKVETLQATSYKPTAADHVGDSPVGTSSALLHKTFGVASVVDLPFELPAHAANPQLRGTYRSFAQQARNVAADAEAKVEFLVLSQQQYDDFLNGRPGDALFSADGAHDQDVNFSMPPTFGQPAKYYLVFRNSGGGGKKMVEADFRVDF